MAVFSLRQPLRNRFALSPKLIPLTNPIDSAATKASQLSKAGYLGLSKRDETRSEQEIAITTRDKWAVLVVNDESAQTFLLCMIAFGIGNLLIRSFFHKVSVLL